MNDRNCDCIDDEEGENEFLEDALDELVELEERDDNGDHNLGYVLIVAPMFDGMYSRTLFVPDFCASKLAVKPAAKFRGLAVSFEILTAEELRTGLVFSTEADQRTKGCGKSKGRRRESGCMRKRKYNRDCVRASRFSRRVDEIYAPCNYTAKWKRPCC